MSKVCQLFSGSSGNSILISSKGHSILVDIGVSAKRCENALLDIGVQPESIDAVFITHEHGDHSSGVRVFASKNKIPVFAPAECLESMMSTGLLSEKNDAHTIDYHMELCGIEIMAFKQSHDSVDCVGYRFNLPDGRSVSVCTDTGYITDNAKEILPSTDLIFIESNHETSMVETGPYPYHLKQRILSANGHLSNFACSEYIKELAQCGTTRFVLSHLSRENNMPHIARQTALAALNEIGLKEESDFRLYVSPPENDGRGIVL
ncbi:MAG: MBL fold metallo-hydrolase [Eubacterium sp.]